MDGCEGTSNDSMWCLMSTVWNCNFSNLLCVLFNLCVFLMQIATPCIDTLILMVISQCMVFLMNMRCYCTLNLSNKLHLKLRLWGWSTKKGCCCCEATYVCTRCFKRRNFYYYFVCSIDVLWMLRPARAKSDHIYFRRLSWRAACNIDMFMSCITVEPISQISFLDQTGKWKTNCWHETTPR